MKYLLYLADSFMESSLEELKRAADYRIIDSRRNVVIAEMRVRSWRRLDRARFVYSYFPILEGAKLDTDNYIESIYGQIKKLGLGKRRPLKMECLDINCRQGYSAKDIEVAVGKRLEGEGFNIDIEHPEILAYVVLLNSRCYSGYIQLSGSRFRFIDPFRVYKEKRISRAEFKIVEAFESFDMPAPKVAIDMGAAPGGWSLFLARRGAAVMAIDGAELEGAKIRHAGVKVTTPRLSNGHRYGAGDIRPGSILHLKCNLDKALGHMGRMNADFLSDDINVGGIRSARAVLKYAKFMRSGATLVMTVKCMRRNVSKYTKEVERELKGRFDVVQWRVLPHNRQEITLFAKKK